MTNQRVHHSLEMDWNHLQLLLSCSHWFHLSRIRIQEHRSSTMATQFRVLRSCPMGIPHQVHRNSRRVSGLRNWMTGLIRNRLRALRKCSTGSRSRWMGRRSCRYLRRLTLALGRHTTRRVSGRCCHRRNRWEIHKTTRIRCFRTRFERRVGGIGCLQAARPSRWLWSLGPKPILSETSKIVGILVYK